MDSDVVRRTVGDPTGKRCTGATIGGRMKDSCSQGCVDDRAFASPRLSDEDEQIVSSGSLQEGVQFLPHIRRDLVRRLYEDLFLPMFQDLLRLQNGMFKVFACSLHDAGRLQWRDGMVLTRPFIERMFYR